MDEYILAIHLLVQLMETGKDKRMELWQAMSRRERIQCMCVCGGGDMEGGGNEVLWIHSVVWEHPYQKMKSQSILMVGSKE